MLTAHVVYATMTGNNEEVANIVCDSLTNLNVKVTESEISQTDVTEFAKADILVVCAYTYDEGAMPEEGLDFYDDLQEMDLTGKVYGVAGSGDRFYGEYFNVTVDRFDEAFKKAGATTGAAKVKIDLEPYEEDIEHLNEFAKGLVETASK
ncbi:flavodoxin [Limosilactobacillus sp. STM2_1]|uniref:Flavodoxin n=1 Tax=Limosilactobacillus rudii TaxID=2759755 RepID=A0A7W3YNM2_9LACO|nr:flavodoxin [Limosilactobacillus rudii]MBB1079411.1 flavodoxin [Limosilactobacillus rudii]MBB1097457.1 flavodoxin [Limosilactobacillus rudii]MCD7134566.1 flavodoxin [Limosilactobacillus rudii]